MFGNIYTTATGEILRSIESGDSSTLNDQVDAGESLLTTDAFYSDELYYILAGVLTAKANQTASISATTLVADAVSSVTISGIVNPTIVYVVTPDGCDYIAPVTVIDGNVVFKTNFPGEYTLSLTVFPYVNKSYTIVAS